MAMVVGNLATLVIGIVDIAALSRRICVSGMILARAKDARSCSG
jgi:hypothetical protein